MVSKKREPDSAGPDSKKQKRSDSDPQENEINWYKPGDIQRKWGKKWGRPEGSMYEDLVFQQIDLDKYVDFVDGEPKPTIRIYGTDKKGSSVCLFVKGFQPYFYTPAPEGFTEDYCGQFVKELNERVLGAMRGGILKNISKAVLHAEMCSKENIYGYNSKGKIPFIKVTVASWQVMTPCKNVMEPGWKVTTDNGQKHHNFSMYESHIDYEVRFMVDCKVRGASWITVPKGMFHERMRKETTCSIEAEVDYADIIPHEPEGEWADIAPMRIFSYDIECAGRKGVFPEAEHDPVIQIACMVQNQGDASKNGDPSPFVRMIFTLNSCSPIVGNHVFCYEKEIDMLEGERVNLHPWLEGFAELMRLVDPDIITGYNIMNFDTSYLVNRANTLKSQRFGYLGRISSNLSKVKDAKFSSKQMGTREYKEVNIDGRIQLDVMVSIVQNYKLRSYNLNAVSYHFLKEQKEDVHHSIISDLQAGTDSDRRRLAVYCLKDALLPLRLMDKLMFVVNTMEMARVTGVPVSYLLTRGQSVKVMAQLLRESSIRDLVMPVLKTEQSDQYEGATVIDPIRGYYKEPITTLDFASLYPSIMRAHNLCYTTLLSNKNERSKLDTSKFIKTPTGDEFVKPEVREGLLPLILKNLLEARGKAKKELKIEQCPFKKKVLDGRQLALKISANSVYGFTGAQVGKLPCLPISGSVTAFGRLMIEQTMKTVEEQYTRANGFEHDAKVVYGDTDSVMIKFGTSSIAKSFELGAEAAKFVTSKFISPIKLEFEKVYCPYLLINKKRYAGLYYSSNPDKHDKMDCKGIETVRRDNCRLASELISKCLDMMLINRDPDGAIDYAKDTIRDLLLNRVDISKLVITKELTQKAENYANKQAHCELAERMRKRDPGSAPQLGDRVPYVFIKKPKNTPAYEKAEDPLFVLDNSVPIDAEHYLHHSLENPLMRIFEPVLGEKAKSVLFKGDHTRVKAVTTSKVGGLFKFTQKRETCMGCKAVMPKGVEGNICPSCKENEIELYLSHKAELDELRIDFNKLWSQCQRCQKHMQKEVLCSNCDCPIFYRRKKIRSDLVKAENTLAKFGPVDW